MYAAKTLGAILNINDSVSSQPLKPASCSCVGTKTAIAVDAFATLLFVAGGVLTILAMRQINMGPVNAMGSLGIPFAEATLALGVFILAVDIVARRLGKKMHALEIEKSVSDGERNALSANVEKLRQLLTKERENRETTSSTYEDKIRQLTGQIAKHNADATTLQNKLELLNKSLTDKENELAETKRQLKATDPHAASQNLNHPDDRQQELMQKNEDLLQEIENLKGSIRTHENQVKDKQVQISVRETEIEKLTNEKQEIEKQLASANEDLGHKEKDLVQKISEIEIKANHIESLQDELSKAQKLIQDLKLVNNESDATKKLEEALKDRIELETKITNAETELQKEKLKIEEQQSEILRLKGQINTLGSNAGLQEQEIIKLEETKKSQENQIKTLEKNLIEANSKMEKMQGELEGLKDQAKKIEQLETAIQEKENEAASLKTELTDKQQAIGNLENQLSSYKSAAAEIKSFVKEKSDVPDLPPQTDNKQSQPEEPKNTSPTDRKQNQTDENDEENDTN